MSSVESDEKGMPDLLGPSNMHHCLFCARQMDRAENLQFCTLIGSQGNQQLNKDLWGLFILRNLVKLPENETQKLLQDSLGISMGNWFGMCEDCSKIVDDAMKTYQMVIKLKKYLHKLENLVKEKILESVENQNRTDFHGIVPGNTYRKIRNYVKCLVIKQELDDQDTPPIVPFLTNDDAFDSQSSILSDKVKFEGYDSNEENVDQVDVNTIDKKGKRYKCHKCPASYRHRSGYNYHRRMHELSTSHHCQTCNFPVVSSEMLQKHVNSKHARLRGKEKEQRSRLQKAKVSRDEDKGKPLKGKKRYRCLKCSASHNSLSGYFFHKRLHQLPETQHCHLCNFPASTAKILQTHMSRKHRLSKSSSGNQERQGINHHRPVQELSTAHNSEIANIPVVSSKILQKHVNIKRPQIAGKEKGQKSPLQAKVSSDEDKEKHVKGKKRYKCLKCSASYNSWSGYFLHKRLHQLPETQHCQLCNFPASTSTSLQKHMGCKHRQSESSSGNQKEQGTSPRYKCLKCDKSHKSKSGYFAHKRKHKLSETQHCHICKFRASASETLREHMNYEHPESKSLSGNQEEEETHRRYKCLKCHASHKSLSGYFYHKRLHKLESTLHCHICNFPVNGEVSLRAHLTKKHSAPKISVPKPKNIEVLVCQECGHKTKDSKLMEYHMKRHQYFQNLENVDGKVKCKICEELCTNKILLRRHFREKHADELGIEVFKCDLCPDKNYARREQLLHHIAEAHEKMCKFCCDSCGYMTMKRASFNVHLKSHLEEKEFVCDECPTAFKIQSSLRNHIRQVHENKRGKEFKCKYCITHNVGVLFESRTLLHRHLRTCHLDLYVHACDECECDKSYITLQALQFHKKKIHDK